MENVKEKRRPGIAPDGRPVDKKYLEEVKQEAVSLRKKLEERLARDDREKEQQSN